jgi:cystathionine beta-lyase/cystathionine gamma-synthase
MKLAQFLKAHPKVTWVRYPGLPEHGQYDIAQRQMESFGSMIAFWGEKGS